MRLELGAGQRPTRGYTHQDLHPGPHIEHVGEARMLELPDESCSEVLAIAFVEHLTYDHACDTFRNVHRLLEPGGTFYFDVPDYPTWCRYYLNHLSDSSRAPVPMDHVRRTLFGWGRFPGDSHLYGWDADHLTHTLKQCGLIPIGWDVQPFKARCYRARFDFPDNAHLYVTATK